MESEHARETPDIQLGVLAAAEDARRRLTAPLRLPAGTYPALALATAVQIGSAAIGIAKQSTQGLGVLLGGLAVLLGAAALLLHRFRRRNGVRVDGLALQVILATGATASTAYVAAFAAATWAAFGSHWVLVAVAAAIGGAGCALGLRHWWRSYRDDPAAHARGASPRTLASLALAAGLGCAALLLAG